MTFMYVCMCIYTDMYKLKLFLRSTHKSRKSQTSRWRAFDASRRAWAWNCVPWLVQRAVTVILTATRFKARNQSTSLTERLVFDLSFHARSWGYPCLRLYNAGKNFSENFSLLEGEETWCHIHAKGFLCLWLQSCDNLQGYVQVLEQIESEAGDLLEIVLCLLPRATQLSSIGNWSTEGGIIAYISSSSSCVAERL